MASYATGRIHIPLEPEEPFQTAFEFFNEKVQTKLDYSAWRSKIYNKVRYIQTRSKTGKKAPWYRWVMQQRRVYRVCNYAIFISRPYFLHFLGNTRRGLKYVDEPKDYVPPPTPAKKRKLTTELFAGEEDVGLRRKSPKRLTVSVKWGSLNRLISNSPFFSRLSSPYPIE